MKMDRRSFLSSIPLLPVLGRLSTTRRLSENYAMTVLGPISASELGIALSHEHVLVDFIGADQVSPNRYDRDEVFEVVLPYLEQIKALGCRSFFEFTPAYLGRDPVLLRRLSEATGHHIITNTGYYGARDNLFLPGEVTELSVDELVARWRFEFEQGIEDTGIKPGFLKIGVNPGPLSELHARLVRAAARVHAHTGLTIAVHTGPAEPAFQQLDILEEEGVHPSAWIWVHSQNESDLSRHTEAAARGAWVAFDGLHPERAARYLDLLQHMKTENLLHRVLLSHDAGWYSVGEEGGGDFRGYDYLFASFLEMLRSAGFSDSEVEQLLVLNPAEAFSVRKRLL